jgi:energy-coupling factor transporter ATP-binding protein EcfA2
MLEENMQNSPPAVTCVTRNPFGLRPTKVSDEELSPLVGIFYAMLYFSIKFSLTNCKNIITVLKTFLLLKLLSFRTKLKAEIINFIRMNNQDNFPRGSEWRKWDLHVHTPLTKSNDSYVSSSGKDVWNKFCDEIEKSDVRVIGITDYFSFDNYFTFIDKFRTKFPNSDKVFFPNVELRLNESVNSVQEEVNIHLIFHPEIIKDDATKFLTNLKTVKTDSHGREITCNQLQITKSRNDYEGATVTRKSIINAIKEVFGEKIVRQDYVLILAAVNNDGARPERGKQRKEIITDEIDKFCDAFFGGSQNTNHFLKMNRLEDKEQKIKEKPVLSGCDAHSFDQLQTWLGKAFHDESTTKEITWIKANLTYEGLLQILIEPKERICISTTKPDEKEPYKIIDKIIFTHTKDFPAEIKFNSNLCSIIGSRSSGKSALLNYIAHAVDKSKVELQLRGPAAKIYWNDLTFSCSVVWADGNTDGSGKVVFLPQGYLSRISDKPEVITEKIKPVLFRKYPAIEAKYKATQNSIYSCNKAIELATQHWFVLITSIQTISEEIKLVGDKAAIASAKADYQKKIDEIKTTLSLTDKEIKGFQKVSADITKQETTLKNLNILCDNLVTEYFNPTTKQVIALILDYSCNPSLNNLPSELKTDIEDSLSKTSGEIVTNIKKMIRDYKNKLDTKIKETSDGIKTLKKDNKDLIEKNKQNEQLLKLVEEFNKQDGFLSLIKAKEDKIQSIKDKAEAELTTILLNLTSRTKAINDLENSFSELDQAGNKIEFGVECSFNDIVITQLSEKYNLKEIKDNAFINDGFINIAKARKQYKNFLTDVYSNKIKLKTYEVTQTVAVQTLTFSEEIRFTAIMEGDSIGGFSESSMTPGKQALFALTLILDESSDAWPLLIDQPEDDLDSRSIYDHIATYFKNKKKGRQIIMVSHNANLVVGADSEQIIVANKHGVDRKNNNDQMFDYLSGSLENTCPRNSSKIVLKSCGIREHA